MVEEKGLPGHVADRIGEFVVLRGQPQELLAKLSEASECSPICCMAVPGRVRCRPQLRAKLSKASELCKLVSAVLPKMR